MVMISGNAKTKQVQNRKIKYMNVNQLLKIYLGANDNGGIMPVRELDKLREHFPETYKENKTKLTSI